MEWDMAVRNAIHVHASGALTSVMLAITQLGSGWVLWPLGFVIVAWLEGKGRRRDAVWLAITLVGAFILNEVAKVIFQRPRPQPFFGLTAPFTFSFPSGHALVSCCFYLAIAELLPRKPVNRVIALILVTLIGLSRVYLGVHYPTDVVGGYLGAIAWTGAVRAADPHRGVYFD